ncbi:MAG: anhydro-N-acetylmuramic acid kinase [candidate division Zixibacteria bacterium]|nr:anhydro-N-acetylmuramic acid kinase [candidate division Zixibacteria bacterium]
MTATNRYPLARLLQKRGCNILGINTGTSMDGLDLALIEIKGGGQIEAIRILKTASYRFPMPVRRTLAHLADADSVSKEEVARAHFALGDWMGGRVLEFARRRNGGRLPDLIASHGQTIGHFPNAGQSASSRTRATWQIGSTAAIAHRTRVVTIGDFRSSDVAAGGMGAPLSGYYHYLLFGDRHVVLNLGGIANISATQGSRNRMEILAFDIGPANMMLDTIARTALGRPYDANGRMAAQGTPDQSLIRRILASAYFQRRPPKTCGREQFGPRAVQHWFFGNGRGDRRSHAQVADLLATATEVTAQAISRAVTKWVEPFTPARSLILVGGGSRNRFLTGRLSECLAGWIVQSSDDIGIPAQYVEPAGFAVLAYETLHNRPGNLGGGTGASPAVLGSISLP